VKWLREADDGETQDFGLRFKELGDVLQHPCVAVVLMTARMGRDAMAARNFLDVVAKIFRDGFRPRDQRLNLSGGHFRIGAGAVREGEASRRTGKARVASRRIAARASWPLLFEQVFEGLAGVGCGAEARQVARIR